MTLTQHQEEVAQGCRCTPASEPFDQWVVVNPSCLLHGVKPIELYDLPAAAERVIKIAQSPMAVFSLVEHGWTREGAGWTHPSKSCHLTQAEAFATLLWEDGNLI